MSILNLPFILETRRNHAIEHATIHILAEQFPGRPLAGHSNPKGFILLGNVPIDKVAAAAAQAVARLRAGEWQLAIHPGCGTNMVTAVLLSSSLAWLSGGIGSRKSSIRWWQLPVMAFFALLGYLFAQALGPVLQARITTEANPGTMHIKHVSTFSAGPLSGYWISTE